jgi:hypothetical protein
MNFNDDMQNSDLSQHVHLSISLHKPQSCCVNGRIISKSRSHRKPKLVTCLIYHPPPTLEANEYPLPFHWDDLRDKNMRNYSPTKSNPTQWCSFGFDLYFIGRRINNENTENRLFMLNSLPTYLLKAFNDKSSCFLAANRKAHIQRHHSQYWTDMVVSFFHIRNDMAE